MKNNTCLYCGESDSTFLGFLAFLQNQDKELNSLLPKKKKKNRIFGILYTITELLTQTLKFAIFVLKILRINKRPVLSNHLSYLSLFIQSCRTSDWTSLQLLYYTSLCDLSDSKLSYRLFPYDNWQLILTQISPA